MVFLSPALKKYVQVTLDDLLHNRGKNDNEFETTTQICKGGGGVMHLQALGTYYKSMCKNSGQFSINPLTWIIKAILGWRIPG